MTRAKRAATAPDWTARFLRALTSGQSITLACKAAGISRGTFYNRRNADEAFRTALAQAFEDSADALEDIARARAARRSDLLLIFLLKGLRPEKYRERQDVQGRLGVSLEVVEEIVEAGQGPAEAARGQAPTNGTPAPASRLCPGPPS
jgi:hypothetical protein